MEELERLERVGGWTEFRTTLRLHMSVRARWVLSYHNTTACQPEKSKAPAGSLMKCGMPRSPEEHEPEPVIDGKGGQFVIRVDIPQHQSKLEDAAPPAIGGATSRWRRGRCARRAQLTWLKDRCRFARCCMAKRLAKSAESGLEETRAAIRRAEAMLGWARQQLWAPMPMELQNFDGGSVGAEQLDQLLRQLIHFRRKVLVRAWTLELVK